MVRDGEAVTTIGPGGYVGEVALLFDVPRTATVVAYTPVRAFRLDRDGFARLVAGTDAAGGPDRSARRVVEAMRRHPEMVAGTDRLCTELMRAGHADLIAKIGAEGMYGLAFMQDGAGAGVALKIADGEGQRARFSAALEALRQLGVLAPDEAAALRARFVGELRNHGGLLVGEITTAFQLA